MKLRNLPGIAQELRRRGTATGRSSASILLEALALRWGGQRINWSEYQRYALCDNRSFSAAEKREFIGYEGEPSVNRAMNAADWNGLSYDKILFYSVLEGAGVPYPRVVAIASPFGRLLRGATVLRSKAELEQFLRRSDTYPLFAKPSHGNLGAGADLLESYDAATDMVLTATRGRQPLPEVVRGFDLEASWGQIFQEVIRPDPSIEAWCGPRVPTMRVVVVRRGLSLQLHRVTWKMPTGGNIVDNFQHGKSGNLLAAIDVDTGAVVRIVGPDADGQIAERTVHPHTGVALWGRVIPGWAAIRELAMQVANLLPRYRLLHLDVAPSAAGPLAVEVNVAGNMDLHQYAYGRGFLTEPLVSALAEVDSRKAGRKRRS